MKSSRTFTRKNGKLEIKTIEDRSNIYYTPVGSKSNQVYEADKMSFITRRTCSFLRPYIPGEYDGFTLPADLDLSEITHTYVIIAGATGIDAREGEQHVLAHLQPIGETYKIVVFDIEGGKSSNARVPLLPEQAEIIRQDIEKEKRNGD